MAIKQPIGTDPLSNPDHGLSHRIIAVDEAAPVKTVTVDENGTTRIGDQSGPDYLKIDSAGNVTFLGDATIALPYANILMVATAGAPFSSIKAANDSIGDASVSNRYCILVNPGTYVEDPIIMQDYVDIKAIGSAWSTVVTPTAIGDTYVF